MRACVRELPCKPAGKYDELRNVWVSGGPSTRRVAQFHHEIIHSRHAPLVRGENFHTIFLDLSNEYEHSVTLQDTAVLAGRDDNIHNCSPRDDYGYYHPPAALLVLNWWRMSLSGVKLGIMSSITLRGPKKSFGAIPRAKPSGWPLRIFLSPSGMIKSRIPRLPHDNATKIRAI